MRLVGLYPLKGFTLPEIVISSSGKVLLKAVSSSHSAICPYCQTLSQKRHSVYVRKPQALPCSSTPIQLILSVQRYFCENPACTHKTFAERIPDTAHFYSRRTIDLEALLQILAFEMSAESVGRVCAGLKVSGSPDSVLRLIRKNDASQEPEVRVLGMDDWAIQKGQTYGTLLVDLEKHQAIGLLPDRTQNTLSAWLQNHPEIEIISDYQTMAAEDMSYFLDAVPGTFFFVGSANAERGLNYPHHHPRFNFDESVIPLGIELLAAAAASYVIPT